jgi:hypothetical protein
MLYNLRGHSAQVESLFSSLSLNNVKCRSSMLPHNLKMLGGMKYNISKERVHFCGQPVCKKVRLQLETGNHDDDDDGKNNSFLDNLFEYVEELNDLESPEQILSTSADTYLESLYEFSILILTLGTESVLDSCFTSLSSFD